MKKEEYQPTEKLCLDVEAAGRCKASHCWKMKVVKWLAQKEQILGKALEDVGCLLVGKRGGKDGTSKSLAKDRFDLHLVLFFLLFSLPM